MATSFNGRTGDVVPQASDYSAFYLGRGETVDAYSKEETLSADTKALFGLEADATPDAAFALLHGAQTGGVKIVAGSYIGTGTYGASAPNSLTFGFSPKLLVVLSDGIQTTFVSGSNVTCYQNISGNEATRLTVTWSGNTVSWYAENYGADISPLYQLNKKDVIYHYVAIG